MCLDKCLSCFGVVPMFDGRQIYFKGGSSTNFAVASYLAAVALNDSKNRSQSQSCSLADFLGGEKRLEYVLDGVSIHTLTCIRDGQQDIATRFGFEMSIRVIRVHHKIRSLYYQISPRPA